MSKNKNIAQDVPAETRKDFIKDSCTLVEEQVVRKNYTADEKSEMKDKIAEDGIQMMDDEDKFSSIKKEWSAKITEKKVAIKETLKTLRKGFTENKEEVFGFDDQEEGVMNYFNAEGKYLWSRPLEQHEKQLSLLTGTHDK